MYKSISLLDYGIRNQIKNRFPTSVAYELEMSEFDTAFLCGLIEEYRPQKI